MKPLMYPDAAPTIAPIVQAQNNDQNPAGTEHPRGVDHAARTSRSGVIRAERMDQLGASSFLDLDSTISRPRAAVRAPAARAESRSRGTDRSRATGLASVLIRRPAGVRRLTSLGGSVTYADWQGC